jgi:hypothetical protein
MSEAGRSRLQDTVTVPVEAAVDTGRDGTLQTQPIIKQGFTEFVPSKEYLERTGGAGVSV